MPVTGIPLPFVSSGGSSLLTNWIGLGLLINVQTQSQAYLQVGDGRAAIILLLCLPYNLLGEQRCCLDAGPIATEKRR